MAQALELPRADHDWIWLVSAGDLRRRSHDPLKLTAPIFVWLRHVRPWLRNYRSFVASLPKGVGYVRFHDRWKAKFVATQLPVTTRHTLFPPP